MMPMLRLILLLFAGLCGLQAQAARPPIQYPWDLLNQRAKQYEEDIRWNLDNALLPRLKPAERTALGKVRLEVPIRGGLAGHHALRRGKLGVIVMPAESVRFFSDLCTATAWLAARGYSLSTITDYLGMLKYGDPTSLGLRGMPLPLDALLIPEAELSDSGVESRRSACFSTGVVFILAHEIGHLVLGHRGYDGISSIEAQANEAEADAFALELFSRMGDLPLGALYYFTYASHLETHRGDYGSNTAWRAHVRDTTHPISPERVEALKAGLTRRASRFAAGRAVALTLADEIGVIADALTDIELQQLIRLQGETTRPYMLAPRRADFWQVGPPAKQLPNIPFSGYYEGWLGSDSGERIPTQVVMHRDGNRVSGRYSYAGIGGGFTGLIKGQTMSYRWRQPGGSGKSQMSGNANSLRGSFEARDGSRGIFEIRRRL